jgi:PAS domain S-box-containing protein
MVYYSIISLISFIATFFLGTYVYAQNPKNCVIRLFFIYSVLSSFYSYTDFKFFSSSSYNNALLWMNLQKFWPLLLSVQVHFLLLFTRQGKPINKKAMSLLHTSAIFLIVLLFLKTNTEIKYINHYWARVPNSGNTFVSLALFLFLLLTTLAPTIIGFRYLFKPKGKNIRLQVLLLLIGIIVPTWFSFLKNGILPAMGIDLLVPESLIAFLGWICFAVSIKYFRLFKITLETAADKIISTMKEALLLVNVQGEISMTNHAFHELFGFNKLVTNRYSLSKFLEYSESGTKEITDHFMKEEFLNKMLIFNPPNKDKLYVNFSSSFLKDESQNIIGYVIVISDVSELMQVQKKLRDQQEQMVKIAHQAGMAEIATNVMHNIGNVLNSVSVSSEQIISILNSSKLNGLGKANHLLKEHLTGLSDFLSNDTKGKLLPEYYMKISEELNKEHAALQYEGIHLIDKIKLIKEAIEMQQDYATPRNFNEPFNLPYLVDEVVRMNEESFAKHRINFSRDISISNSLIIEAPKSKLFSILLNIIKNAYESVKLNDFNNRSIKLGIYLPSPEMVQIEMSDNGIGIPEDNLKNIFTFGFTTKENGHGFGLHYCANTLKEMNGSISVKSNGTNKGAVFTLIIPVTSKKTDLIQQRKLSL